MSPNPTRIGLFGGSFDPPHMGHVLGVAWALATGELDRILAIPVGVHAFGKRAGATFHQRVEMTRLAFADRPEVVVDLREGSRLGVTYTVDTVRELAAEHPGATFRLIAGTDVRRDLPKWKEAAEVMAKAPLLELPRTFQGMSAGPLPIVDSTHLREMIATHQDTTGLIPDAVRGYIDANGLYR